MRIHIGHELIRFGFLQFEESMMSAEIYEKHIAKYKKEAAASPVITVGEMKKRFNEISLSFPDAIPQRFDDNKSNDEPITHYVINEIIPCVIKEAINQVKDPNLFELRFLPIIEQIVEKFTDVLDHTKLTDEEARECLEKYYSQIGKSYLYSFQPIDQQDAVNKIEAASMRAANNYQGQFNHLPMKIADKILLQYGAKLSRQFVNRKKYPKKSR